MIFWREKLVNFRDKKIHLSPPDGTKKKELNKSVIIINTHRATTFSYHRKI